MTYFKKKLYSIESSSFTKYLQLDEYDYNYDTEDKTDAISLIAELSRYIPFYEGINIFSYKEDIYMDIADVVLKHFDIETVNHISGFLFSLIGGFTHGNMKIYKSIFEYDEDIPISEVMFQNDISSISLLRMILPKDNLTTNNYINT